MEIPIEVLRALLPADVLERLTVPQPEKAVAGVEKTTLTKSKLLKMTQKFPEGEWTRVYEYGTPRSAGASASYWKDVMQGRWSSYNLICARGKDLLVFRAPKPVMERGK